MKTPTLHLVYLYSWAQFVTSVHDPLPVPRPRLRVPGQGTRLRGEGTVRGVRHRDGVHVQGRGEVGGRVPVEGGGEEPGVVRPRPRGVCQPVHGCDPG